MASHTASGEWKSFEIRMRRRRAERLLIRASTATNAHRFEEARVAIDEARMLWPSAPGLTEIERRLAEPSIQLPKRPSRWREFAVGTAMVVFAASAAFAAAILIRNRPADLFTNRLADLFINRSAAVAPSSQNTRVEASDVTLPAPIHAEPPKTSTAEVELPPRESQPEGQTAPTKEAPRLMETPRPTDTPRPTYTPRPTETPQHNARAGTSSAPVIGMPAGPTDLTPERTGVTFVPPLEIPSAPAPAAAAKLPAPSVKPSAGPAAPAVSASPPEPQPDALVSGVLTRFASAYSTLDVDAAVRVWPKVNRSALARAFEGLASQHVSLSDCQIHVNGAAAQARCMGMATWRPKVGGGKRTDSRTWNFELEKAGAGWQIVSARVQNK